MGEDKVYISMDVDMKIHAKAREYWSEHKNDPSDKLDPLQTMISGALDDGTPTSLFVKIQPNPINSRLATGWKVVAEDRVWEIPQAEMERSRLL
ncbi:MAG: hypothetical protein ACYTDX_03760 [Planctomycetota bacterium]|jgi:hypothetical protein